MTPDTSGVLLHAYIDGELDAASTMELEARLKASTALRQEWARLATLQNSVQTRATRFNAPSGLKQNLFAPSPVTQRDVIPIGVPPWWRTLAVGTSIAAMMILLWSLSSTFVGRDRNTVQLEEVVSAHVRSLLADHLTDLTSKERHEIKPWLSNRLDFAPRVLDFANEGFSLVGGRLDYLGGKPAAAIVYRYRQHIINVFIQPSAPSRSNSAIQVKTHRGYNSASFVSGEMNHWVVSDLNRNELGKLATSLQQPPLQ